MPRHDIDGKARRNSTIDISREKKKKEKVEKLEPAFLSIFVPGHRASGFQGERKMQLTGGEIKTQEKKKKGKKRK